MAVASTGGSSVAASPGAAFAGAAGVVLAAAFAAAFAALGVLARAGFSATGAVTLRVAVAAATPRTCSADVVSEAGVVLLAPTNALSPDAPRPSPSR
jgi:hypothetical protein